MSYGERNNLTTQMHMRRFTRLINGFSKKAENHACAVALHTMYYNFVHIRSKLRLSPGCGGWDGLAGPIRGSSPRTAMTVGEIAPTLRVPEPPQVGAYGLSPG